MRSFLNSFFGGFLGKVAGGAFLAACVALGMGPDKWVAMLIPDSPPENALTVARIVFMLAAALLAGVWAENAYSRIGKPDFELEKWKNHRVYFVWVAACLWAEVKPSSPINEDHPAYPALQKIKGALVAGQISAVYGGTGMKAQVDRDELIKLAISYDEKPKFLFPG